MSQNTCLHVHVVFLKILAERSEAIVLRKTEARTKFCVRCSVLASRKREHIGKYMGYKWLKWKSTLDNSAGRLSADACAWALIFTNSIAVLSVFPQNSLILNVPKRITNMQRKEKEINTHRLAIEGKRRNGGPRGCPLSAAETNLPKA